MSFVEPRGRAKLPRVKKSDSTRQRTAAPVLNWPGKRAVTPLVCHPAVQLESHGEAREGWRHALYWGDNLHVMGHLLERFRSRIQLVYIDPPFGSQASYESRVELRGPRASGAPRQSVKEVQYDDIWEDSEYLQLMYERLSVLRELLSLEGSVVVHCDASRSHHLRCLLDEVFGAGSFLNEIYWHYYNKMPDTRKGLFPRATDTLLWYARQRGEHQFTPLEQKREEPVKQLVRRKHQGRMVNARDAQGKLLYRTSETRVVDNVWRLPMLQPADKVERLGYPTQKPEALLERVLLAATRPGDLVFDAFMGSGTTLGVATKLGRRCLGADSNPKAVQLTARRLSQLAQSVARGETPGVKNGLSESRAETKPRWYLGFDVFSVAPGAGQGAAHRPTTTSSVEVVVEGQRLRVRRFGPQRLKASFGLEEGRLADWRPMVDAVFIDFDYDGQVLRPSVSDVPGAKDLARGEYPLPPQVGTIRVKIVDVLGDVHEAQV